MSNPATGHFRAAADEVPEILTVDKEVPSAFADPSHPAHNDPLGADDYNTGAKEFVWTYNIGTVTYSLGDFIELTERQVVSLGSAEISINARRIGKIVQINELKGIVDRVHVSFTIVSGISITLSLRPDVILPISFDKEDPVSLTY